jgi:dihydrofolate reductase
MGALTYSMITSLDGYVADATGGFDWAHPDEELHRFINEASVPIGTFLYGRRMYETMVGWETMHTIPDVPDFILDWARLWQAADKVVYSTTLDRIDSARTRLERRFDPDAVRALKASTERDLSVSGPGLAAAALGAGLVDEVALYMVPSIVGGGNPCFPDGLWLDLELLDERRFGGGVVYVRYAVRSVDPS